MNELRSIRANKTSKVFRIMIKMALFVPELVFLVIAAGMARIWHNFHKMKPKANYFLGSEPIINNLYWKKAIEKYAKAETYTSRLYTNLNRDDWDTVIDEKFNYLPRNLRGIFALKDLMFKADVLVCSYNGFAINDKLYWRIQAHLFKFCRIKVIVIPYGSDAYDYATIRSPMLLDGLMNDYPQYSKLSKKIRARINYWNLHADFVIPGVMGFDGLGRWDLLLCSPLVLDTEYWSRKSETIDERIDAQRDLIVVGHFPNHEHFKGTKFIETAVDILKKEGFNVELLKLSGLNRQQIRDLMTSRIDILFDQINYVGYGLTALEAMSCSLPVIGNLTSQNYTDVLLYHSYLGECPIISVDHRDLLPKLRKLIGSASYRIEIGEKGRNYVEKYHSIERGSEIFHMIHDKLFNKKEIDRNYLAPNLEILLKKQDTGFFR